MTRVTFTFTGRSLTERLTEWLLDTRGAKRLTQLLCARVHEGHNYRVHLVASEDQGTFVLDPNTTCKNCAKPMSSKQYDELVLAYEQSIDEDAEAEDELW